MKANQVVIVMDRAEAKHIHAEAQCGMLLLEPDAVESLRAALDRDPDELVEQVARSFHDNYERLAPEYGYRTREESAVDWTDVPANNKALMLATVRSVLAVLGEEGGPE